MPPAITALPIALAATLPSATPGKKVPIDSLNPGNALRAILLATTAGVIKSLSEVS